jgi:hypothetical protein
LTLKLEVRENFPAVKTSCFGTGIRFRAAGCWPNAARTADIRQKMSVVFFIYLIVMIWIVVNFFEPFWRAHAAHVNLNQVSEQFVGVGIAAVFFRPGDGCVQRRDTIQSYLGLYKTIEIAFIYTACD